RENLRVEVVEHGIVACDVRHVAFVRIRNEYERVAFFQGSQELFRNDQTRQEDSGPRAVEFVNVHVQAAILTKMLVIFGRRNRAALISAIPEIIAENFLETLTRQIAARGKPIDTQREVEIDQNFAQIKEQRFNLHRKMVAL